MADCILDIETVGLPLDDEQQAYLAKAFPGEEPASKAALFPFTGKIVCIGMMNFETGGIFQPDMADEAKGLSEFWVMLRRFKRIVTFNGRGFDVPYLELRSAVNKVKPSIALMKHRYSADPHCDLLDQFTFYGATRRSTLDMYCRMFGIPSPKGELSGGDVGDLYAKGDIKGINEYNANDLRATAALYGIFKAYLQ